MPGILLSVFLLLTNFILPTAPRWRRKWPPTPGFLPGKSPDQRSLEGCRSKGCKESDTSEQETRTAPESRCCVPPPFTDEETVDQSVEVTCPRPPAGKPAWPLQLGWVFNWDTPGGTGFSALRRSSSTPERLDRAVLTGRSRVLPLSLYLVESWRR